VTTPSPDPERVTRLEEAILFAERRIDELHTEVLRIGTKLDSLGTRLASLERLVIRAGEAPQEGVDPEAQSP